MPITFGAVGDIISVCLLVKDLVDALDEARGSKAEYRSVIRELWLLDRALLEIDLLTRTHGNGSTPELQSLCETAQRAANQCKILVAEFLDRVKIYKNSFEDGQSSNIVKKAVMGVRWRVGEKQAVERFRVQVAGTSSSLQMLLATANVNLLALNKKEVKNHLNKIEQRSEQRTSSQQALLLDVRDRIDNATQHITNGNMAMSKIADALRLDWLRQLGTDLKSLLHKVIATNIATYHAIVSIQAVLPSRLERTLIEEPFILEDPIGRIAPVHLQFVTSWEAFNAVLRLRFRDLQGSKKVQDKQYGLQEKATQRDIDQTRPWQRAFLPGQRIEMSFIFHSDQGNEAAREVANVNTCPGCQAPSPDANDADTQCLSCLMWFRRITVVTEVEPPPPVPLPNPWRTTAAFGKPSFSAQLSGPLKPGKRRMAEDDLDGEDDVREFKRVRLVAERKHLKRQRFVSTTAEKSFATFAGLPVSSKLKSPELATLRDSAIAENSLFEPEIARLNRSEDCTSNLETKLEITFQPSTLPPVPPDLLYRRSRTPKVKTYEWPGVIDDNRETLVGAVRGPRGGGSVECSKAKKPRMNLLDPASNIYELGLARVSNTQLAIVRCDDCGRYWRLNERVTTCPECEEYTGSKPLSFDEADFYNKPRYNKTFRRYSCPEIDMRQCHDMNESPTETPHIFEPFQMIAPSSIDEIPAELYLHNRLAIINWRASEEDIMSAFDRTCIKMFLSQSSNTVFNGTAAACFALLCEVYDILLGPKLRANYHRTGSITYEPWSVRALRFLDAALKQDIAGADFLTSIISPAFRRERSHWYKTSHILPEISARLGWLEEFLSTLEDKPFCTVWLPYMRDEIILMNAEERIRMCSVSLG